MNKTQYHYHILGITLLTSAFLICHQQTISADQLNDISTDQQEILSSELLEDNNTLQNNHPSDIAKNISQDLKNEADKGKSDIESYDPNQVTKLQEITKSGSNSLIAVIDTQFDTNHEIYKSQVKTMDDLVTKSKDQADQMIQNQKLQNAKWISTKVPLLIDYSHSEKGDATHGNHVSGILAGEKYEERLKSISPNAQLLLLKVPSKLNDPDFTKAYSKAIVDAVNLGVHVISMSLGKTADNYSNLDKKVEEALLYAKKRGVLLV
ncbi:hypothetical protein HMPREF9318_00484 [Streptococcus urinalis FB127-CNA-2]|uniref:Peptidase, S8/S53 domain protein n=1 Tax=Streptococcus urinalis 2285-97 TaxID=764291 RepID=G5KG76_9STRE|nr:peptidase, S8/S53 domain protein [Streptococcus urinalis 2285-97]EKS22286.1 hypothetical protein HMPREF9318_00484 [Streptococcus urinalis FB127-CNA-2]VEF32098.1 C5a peptidase [Streptococcus urinalis]